MIQSQIRECGSLSVFEQRVYGPIPNAVLSEEAPFVLGLLVLQDDFHVRNNSNTIRNFHGVQSA